jgi:hypothetical protein
VRDRIEHHLRALVFGDSPGDPTADDNWALATERHHGIRGTEYATSSAATRKPARSTAR